MRRLFALSSMLLAVAAFAGPAPGHAQTTTTPPPPPPPKAWIVVDADSGAVIDAANERTALPPASLVKVVTALVAHAALEPGEPVSVSPAAEGMPARKMNMKVGQLWRADDTLHALLLVSANDAAVALAERVGGSLDGFAARMDQAARRLGMEDRPRLRDPSGLDDHFSFDGGSLISARDLAIASRALLADPELAAIVALPEYRFSGGDGNPHRLVNHNRLLKTYAGTIGVKTGYTEKAGRTLIAAARRGDRTVLAVVIDAVDTYGFASLLLDRGFTTPVSALAGLDHLPEVVPVADLAAPPTTVTTEAPSGASGLLTPAVAAADDGGAGSRPSPWNQGALIVAVGGIPAAAVLVQRRRRQVRRRRQARLARRVSANSGSPPSASYGGLPEFSRPRPPRPSASPRR